MFPREERSQFLSVSHIRLSLSISLSRTYCAPESAREKQKREERWRLMRGRWEVSFTRERERERRRRRAPFLRNALRERRRTPKQNTLPFSVVMFSGRGPSDGRLPHGYAVRGNAPQLRAQGLHRRRGRGWRHDGTPTLRAQKSLREKVSREEAKNLLWRQRKSALVFERRTKRTQRESRLALGERCVTGAERTRGGGGGVSEWRSWMTHARASKRQVIERERERERGGALSGLSLSLSWRCVSQKACI